MKRISAILLYWLFATGVYADCYEDHDKVSTTEKIQTQSTDLSTPHFYFRVNSFVIFIPVQYLQDVYQEMAYVYLKNILSAAPLTEHTDIFQGIVFEFNREGDVGYLVADAIESGSAVVMIAEPNRALFSRTVRVITYNNGGQSGGRCFWSKFRGGERLIYRTMDWVS